MASPVPITTLDANPSTSTSTISASAGGGDEQSTINESKVALPIRATAKCGPSPYIVFCCANRDKIKAANPNASFGELGRLLGAAWGELSDAEKKVKRFTLSLLIT